MRREKALGCRGVPRVSPENKNKWGLLALREAGFGRYQENKEPPAEFGVLVPCVKLGQLDTAASGFCSMGLAG